MIKKEIKLFIIILLSLSITFIIGVTKKSYSTYKYEINYLHELNNFVDVKNFITVKIENKDHFIDKIISRNVRQGKIEILKSFETDEISKDQKNYFDKLENDINQINVFLTSFLVELKNKVESNTNSAISIEENYKLLRINQLIKQSSFFKINNISIIKTHKFYNHIATKKNVIAKKINYNNTIYFLISVFLLTTILLIIIFNFRKIIRLIQKL